MSSIQTNKMTNWRWVMCAMLFFATTVNYMDRQVLSLTWKDFISKDFNWTDDDYGTITATFSIFYAFISLFAGKFIDWMGTKKGYIWAIVIWSLGACLHAACGWATLHLADIGWFGENVVKGTLMFTSISVYLFLACRIVLAMGEAGNFPAAIKVTAEYFPKKDRAYATSMFNAGSSVGALAAPLTIPILAAAMGWEMSFIIIGAIGFIWAAAWAFMYEHPHQSNKVNEAELAYINSDEKQEETATDSEENGLKLTFGECFTYRQTWAFIVGKALTDGVWWFFLFWAPAYFSDQPTSQNLAILQIHSLVRCLSSYFTSS